jgi:phenylalanyl-tRNA synthetase beta subunit
LVSEAEAKKEFSSSPAGESYQLLVPKSENHQFYRSTLIPSHVKTINYNLARGNKDLLFFEIASVYAPLPSGNYPEKLLTLSATGKILNQQFHRLVQEVDLA